MARKYELASFEPSAKTVTAGKPIDLYISFELSEGDPPAGCHFGDQNTRFGKV